MSATRGTANHPPRPQHELARVLSKLGVCSRSQAQAWVRAGRVSVDGRVMRDPFVPVLADHQHIAVDGVDVRQAQRVYVMFNKPRGLVVSAADERGRDTVYTALRDAGLPWLGPVGRLDKASEGLLLLSNDTVWAAGITEPVRHVSKTYHVQIDCVPAPTLLAALSRGVRDGDDYLRAQEVSVLRAGEKNAWLEVVLDQGRNRQIRRMLEAQGVGVLRLLRVAIGELRLGTLPKGQWRHLEPDEVHALAATSPSPVPPGA